MDKHYKALIKMYLGASFQPKFPGTEMELWPGKAEIRMDVDSSYHHAAGSMHGYVYFRMLDEVCYFAAMTFEKEFYYVTRSFNIDFTRPFKEGKIIARSEGITRNGTDIIVTGSLYDENGKVLAKGKGVFAKSRINLSSDIGYRLDQ